MSYASEDYEDDFTDAPSASAAHYGQFEEDDDDDEVSGINQAVLAGLNYGAPLETRDTISHQTPAYNEGSDPEEDYGDETFEETTGLAAHALSEYSAILNNPPMDRTSAASVTALSQASPATKKAKKKDKKEKGKKKDKAANAEGHDAVLETVREETPVATSAVSPPPPKTESYWDESALSREPEQRQPARSSPEVTVADLDSRESFQPPPKIVQRPVSARQPQVHIRSPSTPTRASPSRRDVSPPRPTHASAINSPDTPNSARLRAGGRVRPTGPRVRGIHCRNVKPPNGMPTPSKRDQHTAVLWGPNMYVFGGTATDATLFAFNCETREWKRILTTTAAAEPIASRFGHTSVVWEGNMIVYGGTAVQESLAANKVPAFGPVPEKTTQKSRWFSDLLCLNLGSKVWTEIAPVVATGAERPAVVKHHSCVVFNARMLVFGGITETRGKTNALSVLELESDQPIWLPDHETIGEAPPPLSGHSAAVSGQHMFIFGGRNNDSDCTADVFSLSLTRFVWGRVNTDAGPRPAPRSGHTAVVSPTGNILIFGGCTGYMVFSNELWELQLGTGAWRALESPEPLPGRQQHTSVWWDDHLVVFGGGGHPPPNSYSQVFYTTCADVFEVAEADAASFEVVLEPALRQAHVPSKPNSARSESSVPPQFFARPPHSTAAPRARIGMRFARGRGEDWVVPSTEFQRVVTVLPAAQIDDRFFRLADTTERTKRAEALRKQYIKTDRTYKKLKEADYPIIVDRLYTQPLQLSKQVLAELRKKYLGSPRRSAKRVTEKENETTMAQMYYKEMAQRKEHQDQLNKKYFGTSPPRPKVTAEQLAETTMRLYYKQRERQQELAQELERKYLGDTNETTSKSPRGARGRSRSPHASPRRKISPVSARLAPPNRGDSFSSSVKS